jgi:hypothetical protein
VRVERRAVGQWADQGDDPSRAVLRPVLLVTTQGTRRYAPSLLLHVELLILMNIFRDPR